MPTNDGLDALRARLAFAHSIPSFAVPLVQPTPAPSVLAPIVPDGLRGPPPIAHLIPFFAAPLAPAPVPTPPARSVFPSVLAGPPALAHVLPFFAAPTASSISFPGFGPSGAATFVLSLEPGCKITYYWGTDIYKSYSGAEQRCNTTGPSPRRRFEGSAFLLDSSTRDLRGTLQRAASQGSTFLLALPYEELTLTTDSAGTIVNVASTATCDWAVVTQRVMLVGVDDSTLPAVIQAVTATQIRLDVAPGSVGRAGARLMPLVPILLDSQQGFARYAVNVDTWSIRGMANAFGWVGQDRCGVGTQILTYGSGLQNVSSLTDADLLIFDRPNLINGTANDSMLSLAEVVDLGGLPFAIGGADSPDWARPILYSSSDPAEWQWLKAFLRQIRGRQRAFLLPTNRDDLVFVSAVTTTLKVTTAGDYASWWTAPAHRRLALTKTTGTIQYVTVTIAPVNNGDGTLSLTLDAAVTGTVSKISFLELVRLDNGDSDDIPVTWSSGTFSVDLLARTVAA